MELYPINPATLSRYREAFSPSPAKDDPSDAKLLAEILRLHRDKLAVWKPDDEQTRTLTFLNEERRKAVDLGAKLVQRLQAALKLYFPQALEWVGSHLNSPMARNWLLKWPTLEAIQKAKPPTIRLAPRLLSAFGTDRQRHPLPRDLQTYAGIAPVIERSGKTCWTHWRWNCPKFLRQTFHEFAKNSIPYSAWAKAYYELQKKRGKGHHAAVRSLAFKWTRVLHRCWKDRKPYDEALYLRTLKQRGSELANLIVQLPQTVNGIRRQQPPSGHDPRAGIY